MAKPINQVPSDKLALYDKLVSTDPKIERKGVTLPYTSLNGNMFSFMLPTGVLALRLPDDEREAFMKKYKTKLIEQHGAVMKEYVSVPDKLLANTKDLIKYLNLSYEYAKMLKPKSTKRS